MKILLSIFTAFSLIVLFSVFIFSMAKQRQNWLSRISRLGVLSEDHKLKKRLAEKIKDALLHNIAAVLLDKYYHQQFKVKLYQMGVFNLETHKLMLVAFIAGFMLSFLLIISLWYLVPNFKWMSWIVIIWPLFYLRLGGFVLKRSSTNYQNKLQRDFIDFFELYIELIKAGQPNITAWKMIHMHMNQIRPASSKLIKTLIDDFEVLGSIAEAWQRLLEKVEAQVLKDAISIIIDCEKNGQSLDEDLNKQIKVIENYRLEKIHKKIELLSMKLVLPIVLIIMPNTALVFIVPFILKGLENIQ